MNILVSACLLGVACRYDGKSKPNNDVTALMDKYNLIPFCPEVTGGLPTPRHPSEIVGNRVLNDIGEDVTAQYKKGAEEALRIAKMYNCKYDGGYIEGDGITAKLFAENGITVIGESEINNL